MAFNMDTDTGSAVEDPEEEQDGLELPKPAPQAAPAGPVRQVGAAIAPPSDPNAPPPVDPQGNYQDSPNSFRTGSALWPTEQPPEMSGGPTDSMSATDGGDGLELPKASQPKDPSTWDKLTGTYNPGAEDFDARHPIIGKPIRALDQIGGSVMGIPQSMWHMATDPVTPEEESQASIAGAINPVLSSPRLNRFTGLTSAANAAQDYATMKPSARQIAGVLPEAIGQGIGTYAGGEMIGAGTDAITEGAGDYIEHRRDSKGTKNIKTALNTPAGKGGARGAEMDRAIEDSKADLAEIGRSGAGKGKGFKTADAYHKLADKIEERQDEMWQKGHEEPVSRNAKVPVNEKQVVAAGKRELTDAARRTNPHEAKAAEEWLAGIDQPTNLKTADDMVREINGDLKKQGPHNPYGALQVRVRQAVVKALRNEIDRTLIDQGETGVKEVNRRWGALDTVANRAREQAYTEGNKEAKAGKAPEWLHTYAFLHPGIEPISMGLGANVGKMLRPAQGGKALSKGIRQLGKTNLTANMDFPAPEARNQPLLPAPAEQLEGPGAAELHHPDMFPHQNMGVQPEVSVQRGNSGRMQSVKTGMGKPREIGETAEGGPMHETPPPKPQKVDRGSQPSGSREFDEKFGKPAKSRVDAQREESADKADKGQGYKDKGRVRNIGDSEPGDRRKTVERRQSEGTGPGGTERRTAADLGRRLSEVTGQRSYWQGKLKSAATDAERASAQDHLNSIDRGDAGSFDETKEAFAKARKEAGPGDRISEKDAQDRIMKDPKKKAKWEALDPKVKADRRVMDQMLVDEQHANLETKTKTKAKGH